MSTNRSHVRVQDDVTSVFDIESGFMFNMTFGGADTEGALVVARRADGVFMLVDVTDGQVREMLRIAYEMSFLRLF